MNPRLRASLITSGVLHLIVLLILMFGLPWFAPKEEPPPETSVAMVFQGTAKTSMKAPTPAPTPAPAKEVAPPDPKLQGSAVVQRVAPSVLKIHAKAPSCSRALEGSGGAVLAEQATGP